jgi:peptidoglycan hydrolase CwlO-like protein
MKIIFSVVIVSALVYTSTRYYYTRLLKEVNEQYYFLLKQLRDHESNIKQKTDDIKNKLQNLSEKIDKALSEDSVL